MKFVSKKDKDFKLLRFYKKDSAKVKDALNIRLDPREGRELRDLRLALRQAINKARAHEIYKLSLDLNSTAKDYGFESEVLTRELVVQFRLANYLYDKYKSKRAKRVKEIYLEGVERKILKEAEKIADAQDFARDLANTPGFEMTPEVLVKEAKKIAKKSSKFKLKIYGKKELEKMGAGALLAVGSASKHEPKLIVIEYKGSNKKGVDAVFVGKGITFDSGGLDIKPAGKFTDMYQDMSGAGSLLALATLLPSLKLQKNIALVIPSAENAISGDSYRPGDIIKTLSGKTVEVGHTDAEGRLVLADGIAYAKKYKAPLLVTVATLTGAALVALGQEANAIMSNDEDFAFAVKDCSEDVGDYAWPLPLWEEYSKIMQGTFADLNNVQNKGPQGYGGTVTAGAFLYEFAKDVADTFLHIDMAPRMTPGPNDALPKEGGALGGPVRLLLEIVKRRV